MSILIVAQTTCNQGMGRVMYERLPNHQLQGFDDDVVSKYIIFTNILNLHRTYKIRRIH